MVNRDEVPPARCELSYGPLAEHHFSITRTARQGNGGFKRSLQRSAGYFFRYRCSPPETTFRPDRPSVSGTACGRRLAEKNYLWCEARTSKA